jgi:Gluconate 2-dehydrogenase subunit 3
MKDELKTRGPEAPEVPAMRHPEKREQVNRRGFIRGGGLAAIGVTVIPATLTLATDVVYAQSFTSLGEGTGRTLIKMARDIFPHDKLPEKFYADAVTPYDGQAAKDEALKKLLADGIADVDARATKRYGKSYADVATEAERVALLKEIESGDFFQKIKGGLVTGLYDNKAVWPLLGYEGSSWQKGGYLNRGFNDINWL